MKTVATLGPKLTVKALAERWGWTISKLYRLVEGNRIPHIRIGNSIFFEEDALAGWLAAQRRGQIEPLPSPAQRTSHRTRAQECADLGIEEDHAFS